MITIAPVPKIYNELKESLLPRYSQIYSSNSTFREGYFSKQCEKLLCEITGRQYAFMTTSGTSSLICGLLALEVKAGDEVICINSSAAGTVMPIKLLGAIPVYCDLDQYGQMDLATIKEKITPKTKCIEATGLYGDCYDHDAIKDLGIPILNDSAQSFLAKYKNQESCSLGDISICSFNSNKNVPIFGTYGAVLTDNKDLASRLAFTRRNGESFNVGGGDTGTTGIEYLGINAQPTEDKCVQVLCALEKHKEWQEKRKKTYKILSNSFKEIGLNVRPSPTYSETNCHKLVIFVNSNLDFRDRCKAKGLECQPHYLTNFSKNKFLNSGTLHEYPYTDFYNRHAISIPCHPFLEVNDVRIIIDIIKSIVTKEDIELNVK